MASSRRYFHKTSFWFSFEEVETLVKWNARRDNAVRVWWDYFKVIVDVFLDQHFEQWKLFVSAIFFSFLKFGYETKVNWQSTLSTTLISNPSILNKYSYKIIFMILKGLRYKFSWLDMEENRRLPFLKS